MPIKTKEELLTYVDQLVTTNGNNDISGEDINLVFDEIINATTGNYNVFTADNTGTVDVTTEMAAQLEAAALLDRFLLVPPGRYLINDCDPNSSIRLIATPGTVTFLNDINKSVFNCTNNNDYQNDSDFNQAVSAIDIVDFDDGYSFTTNSDKVSRITMASTAGLREGELLHIFSDDYEPWGNSRYGETIVIAKVLNSTQVFAECVMEHSERYATTIFAARFREDRVCKISGINFEGSGDWLSNTTNSTGNGGWCMNLWGYPRATITDCEFSNLWTGAITLRNCPYAVVKDCLFYNINNYKTAAPNEDLDANPYSTVSGESYIEVKYTGHGLTTGDYVILDAPDAPADIGGIPSGEIFEISYPVTVVDVDVFRLAMPSAATSTVNDQGTTTEQITWRSGRLGYGVNAYASTGVSVSSCIFHQTRHAYTDGGYESTNTFDENNWLRYGTTNKSIISNCTSFGCWGAAWDTHEQASGVVFQSNRTLWPLRGEGGGSYQGIGVHIRGRNCKVLDYFQEGGSMGVRVTGINHTDNTTVINNATIKNVQRTGSSQAFGVYLKDGSGFAERQNIHIGNLTCIDTDVGIEIEDDLNVVVDNFTCVSSGESSITMAGGVKLTLHNAVMSEGTYGILSDSNDITIGNIIINDTTSYAARFNGDDDNPTFISNILINGGEYGLLFEPTLGKVEISDATIRNLNQRGILTNRDTKIGRVEISGTTVAVGIEIYAAKTLDIGEFKMDEFAGIGLNVKDGATANFDRIELKTVAANSNYGVYGHSGAIINGHELITNNMGTGAVRLEADCVFDVFKVKAKASGAYTIKTSADVTVKMHEYIGLDTIVDHLESDEGCKWYVNNAYINDGKVLLDARDNTFARFDHVFLDYSDVTVTPNCYLAYMRSDVTLGGADVAVNSVSVRKGDNSGLPRAIFNEVDVSANKKIFVGTIISEDESVTIPIAVHNDDATTLIWNDAFSVFTAQTANVLTSTTNTLSMEDIGKTLIADNTSDLSLVLPMEGTPGSEILVIQKNVGKAIVTAEAGATLITKAGHTGTSERYSEIKLTVLNNSDGNSAEWLMSGDSA